MGRWAHTLFGHDDAIGHAIKIIKHITQGNDRHFAYMMENLLAACPLAVASFYAQEYGIIDQLQGDVDESIDQLILHKLDSGMGDDLFEKYRAAGKNSPVDFGDSKYLPVILAAIMMEYGATIKEARIKNLSDLVEKMQCNEKVAMVFCDLGIRGAGKRQFLAALDHYQAGNPRSFREPSCHCCGKINADIKAEGKTLMKCGGCKNQIAAAWFCDKVRMAGRTILLSALNIADIVIVQDCQRAQWKRHKPNCGTPAGSGIAMFQAYGKNTIGVMMYEGFNV